MPKELLVDYSLTKDDVIAFKKTAKRMKISLENSDHTKEVDQFEPLNSVLERLVRELGLEGSATHYELVAGGEVFNEISTGSFAGFVTTTPRVSAEKFLVLKLASSTEG